jgi:centrin-1
LQESLNSLGSEATNQPIYHMIADLLDEDRDQLDFNEFLDLMTARVSSKDTKEDLKKVFHLFDD